MPYADFSSLYYVKADLLAKYGGVAPKMAEEVHSLAIDPVWYLVTSVLGTLSRVVTLILHLCHQ